MLRKLSKLMILAVIIATTVLVVPTVFATIKNQIGSREFDNGYVVSGDFLIAYNEFGGMYRLGYPITNPFVEDGVLVQYFQRCRFELHHTGDGPVVVLGDLGTDVNPQRTPVHKSEKHPRIVYLPGSDYPVSYYFLDYFRYYGGVEMFGLPLTGIIRTPDGKLTQYFENVILVYDTNDPQAQVYLGDLGETYVETHRSAFPREAFINTMSASPNTIRSLEVILDLDHTFYDSINFQGVDIFVYRDDGIPLANADVEVWLTDGDDNEIQGSRMNLILNEEGYTKHVFPLEGGEQKEVITVHVRADYGGITETECLLFQIWRIH